MKIHLPGLVGNTATKGIGGDLAESLGAHLASWAIGSFVGIGVLATIKLLAMTLGV